MNNTITIGESRMLTNGDRVKISGAMYYDVNGEFIVTSVDSSCCVTFRKLYWFEGLILGACSYAAVIAILWGIL